MGKKAVKRGGGSNSDDACTEPSSVSKRATSQQGSKWLRLVVVAGGAASILYHHLSDECVAAGSVRGPADAVPTLCTVQLTSSLAAEFGVDTRLIPAKAVVRVCLSPPHGRVLVIDDFLKDAEVVHMRELLVKGIGRAVDDSQPGYRTFFAAGNQYPKGIIGADGDGASTEEHRGDLVLNAIEARMANFTGVPSNMFESLLQFSHDFPVASSVRKDPNLHHDKNSGAPRYVTSLTYLTEMQLGCGGHTIFPALATPESSGSETEWNKTFHGIYEKAFSGMKQGDPWPSVQVDRASGQSAGAAAVCDAVNRNSLSYFAVLPRPGRTVFFWHEDTNGAAVPSLFHTSCPVYRGDRYTLQKFKNYAPDHPHCSRSWYCKL